MSAENRDAVRLRVHELAAKNGGRITLEEVIEEARDKASVLHPHFTWNVKEAAHKCHLDEARTLLRSIRMHYVENTQLYEVIAFVRDPGKAAAENGYIETAVLRTDLDLARAALVAEFSRAAAAMRRAVEVAKALDLDGEVGVQLQAIESLKARVSNLEKPRKRGRPEVRQ